MRKCDRSPTHAAIAAAWILAATFCGDVIAAAGESASATRPYDADMLRPEQIRACLHQRAELIRREAELAAEETRLRTQAANVRRMGERLSKEQKSMDWNDLDEVSAFRAEVDLYTRAEAQYNQRAQAYNEALNTLRYQQDNYNRDCADKRYYDDDYRAVLNSLDSNVADMLLHERKDRHGQRPQAIATASKNAKAGAIAEAAGKPAAAAPSAANAPSPSSKAKPAAAQPVTQPPAKKTPRESPPSESARHSQKGGTHVAKVGQPQYFYVQLGAFRQQASVDELRKKIGDAYPLHLQRSHNGLMIVRAGPFDSRKAAKSARDAIAKQFHINGLIRQAY